VTEGRQLSVNEHALVPIEAPRLARTEPSADESRWPDERMAVALQMTVEAMHEVVGFETVSIGIVRDDRIVTIAKAGTGPFIHGPVTHGLGSDLPLGPIEVLLARSEPLGAWRHGRADHAVTTDRADVSAPAPLRSRLIGPYDTLLAPIHDGQGRLRGVLSAAGGLPNGRPADNATCLKLDTYAARATRVVLAALEHEERREQIRLLESARLLVSNVAGTNSFRDAFELAAPILAAAFRLTGMRLAAFETEQVLWHGDAPDPASHDDYNTHLPLRRRAADSLWSEQAVSIIGLGQETNVRTTPERVAAIKQMLMRTGLDSLMLVPLGAADRAVGALWLYRGTGHWTDHEQRVLKDVGRDLGRLFVNAQALYAEQRLAQRMQELESYKRTLISTISHELRTPLAGILSNAEFLVNAESATDIRRSAHAMARGAARMTGLVDELLLIARLDEPSRTCETRLVGLAEVTREAVELHRPVSERADITVELSADDSVVLGRREDLMVMVTNLIGNAVKYSDPGDRVRVEIERREDTVVLEVADTGIGIEPNDLERLFGEFQRGTDAATLARPGSGLGLAIVDRIVRNHHGTVEVESARGEGSRFIVLLPAAD